MRWLCVTFAPALFSLSLNAQTATGIVQGRVSNSRNGEYLAGARVTVESSALQTFTDSDGYYRLSNVPAGPARLSIFYTGLGTETTTVNVAPAAPVQADLALGGAASGPGVVQLDEVVVRTSREMDAAALAINEQRFAPNIKTVVATDEFGDVAEGNVAEFLKFLPGVTVDYTGGNARDVSLNGVPSDFVPITVDGFSVASAAGTGTERAVQSDMVSLNNLSRIEVDFSPTPESQGSALAGSVNMVPRSSFERARPVLKASAYVMMRDHARNLSRQPGPKPSKTPVISPGFDFSYVAPVNKRFGYTLSGGLSSNYSSQDLALNSWRGAGLVTNGNAFPHTTPDQPYLSAYRVEDEPKVTTRRSFGATVDYKLTAYDRVTFGVQYSSFDVQFRESAVTFDILRVPADGFTTTSTRSAPGQAALQTNHQERNRFNRTFMPTFVWRHDGPVWKSVLGLGYSQQRDSNHDMDQGYFRNVVMRRTGVNLAFDDIFHLRPGSIAATTATGAAVDPYSLSTYSLVSANSQPSRNISHQQTAYGNLRRDFVGKVPLTIKTGFDFRESTRDLRGGTILYNYVGADGRGSTTPIGNDDSAAPFLDPIYSERVLPFGFPKLEVPSNREIYEHFVAHPGHFTKNENSSYRSLATTSKYSQELISAVFLRADVSLLQNRLKLIGGVRAEQTNVKAFGPLTDPTRNYRRSPSGDVLLGPDGRPQLIETNPNSLAYSQLTLIDRGTRTDKEYLRLFPSLNASFNLQENLILRAAYYQSVGRPNFVQYSGGIQLPDLDEAPSNTNRIVSSNPAIKAWQGRTVNVRLERYFEGVGQLSVGAFRREIDNFFGGVVTRATAELLEDFHLDPATYGNYDVQTQYNVPGTVRMEGFDISYKQALTFLPHWARGVQVFANGTSQRLLGDENSNFNNFIRRSTSWGASLTRPKFSVRVNWNYRDRQRNDALTGVGIEPGTFNYSPKRLYIGVQGEYYFWKRLAVFANLQNIGDTPVDSEIYGPNVPEPAQLRQRIKYGSLWTFGVKGTW
jgi:iron complex outermembrane recepter protein